MCENPNQNSKLIKYLRKTGRIILAAKLPGTGRKLTGKLEAGEELDKLSIMQRKGKQFENLTPAPGREVCLC